MDFRADWVIGQGVGCIFGPDSVVLGGGAVEVFADGPVGVLFGEVGFFANEVFQEGNGGEDCAGGAAALGFYWGLLGAQVDGFVFVVFVFFCLVAVETKGWRGWRNLQEVKALAVDVDQVEVVIFVGELCGAHGVSERVFSFGCRPRVFCRGEALCFRVLSPGEGNVFFELVNVLCADETG